MSFRPFTDVWILARPKVKYFGAYPAGFLQRARDLIACSASDQVLHVCGGRVRDYKCGPGCTPGHYHGFGPNDITMDYDQGMAPDLHCDAKLESSYLKAMSVNPQIQGVLADPPYNVDFSKEYKPGSSMFPTAGEIVKHSLGILPVGSRIGILSMEWPRYPKAIARQIAVAAVYVGNGNVGRTFAVYERTK